MKRFIESSIGALFHMVMLYAGRVSGVLVAVVFLPMYSRFLGAEQFGAVAVILSLQSLLVMMDLGMSSLISRDFAVAQVKSPELLASIIIAERCLVYFYVTLFAVALPLALISNFSKLGVIIVPSSIILFCFMVLQNLYYSALVASRNYYVASWLQIVGVACRAAATAFVLLKISSTLNAFILTQTLFGGIHFFVTRIFFLKIFRYDDFRFDNIGLVKILTLLKRSKSLALFSIAGAAVTQLDKPIVTAFISATEVAPYFLATTFCIGSISVLAGPVSQFFQPQLLNSIETVHGSKSDNVIVKFVLALICVTVIPSIFLWTSRDFVIHLWMGNNAKNLMITHYVGILLPGVAIGLLGFVPYSLLIAVKDFKFQARLSVMLTVMTLICVSYCAYMKSIEGVCYVYSIYNVCSTGLSWIRAMYHRSIRSLAKKSFAITITVLTLVLFACIVGKFIF